MTTKGIACNNNCGVMITFDPNVKSTSGKMIPLELETGKQHNCKNSKWNLEHNRDTQKLIVKILEDLRLLRDEKLPMMEKRISDLELSRWSPYMDNAKNSKQDVL
jgi:hypothetical protein